MKRLSMGVAAVTLMAAGVATAGELVITPTGYARVGVATSSGDEFRKMQADGAWHSYRLGNEDDFYVELGANLEYDLENAGKLVGGGRFHTAGDNNDLTFSGNIDANVVLREMWAGYQGFGEGAFQNSTLWGGRRFYKRKDIHILDFYYDNYTSYNGYGGGLENVNVGYGDVSVAGFNNNKDTVQTFDARWEGIKLAEDLYGEIGGAYSITSGDATGDDGAAIRVHVQKNNIFGGYMKASIQHGYGAAWGFSADGSDWASADRTLTRFQVHGLASITDKFDIFYVGLHQIDNDDGDLTHWTSFGVRPNYIINDNFSVALETGVDLVNTETQTNNLFKATLSGAYTFGKSGFWARPQLRAFATYGNWNEVGAISNQANFDDDTQGTTFGLQFETWF